MTALMGKKAQDAGLDQRKTNEFPPQLTVRCHKVGQTENGVAYHDPGLLTSDWCLRDGREWRKLLFVKGRRCIQFAKSFKVTLRFIIATVVRCESANEISLDSNKKKKRKAHTQAGSLKSYHLYKCTPSLSFMPLLLLRAAENNFEERYYFISFLARCHSKSLEQNASYPR